MMKPRVNNLFFIGLAQPSISIFRLVYHQSKWAAAYLAGEFALPDAAQQERTILADEKKHMGRYYASARHTMQLDQDIYFAELASEVRRGRKRARALGYGPDHLPVPRATGPVEIQSAAE
jgi:hypothetical protein